MMSKKTSKIRGSSGRCKKEIFTLAVSSLFFSNYLYICLFFNKQKRQVAKLMGVPQIWEIVRTHQPSPIPRYPLRTLIQNKRIAIDAYNLLFECGFLKRDSVNGLQRQVYYGKAVLNLISRLKELISLDAWFILVFDGWNKPVKVKRCSSANGPAKTSHPSANLKSMATVAVPGSTTSDQVYSDGRESGFMQVVLSVLQMFKVSYIIADGEGEAYCCYLQTVLKLVDFVWSNDSDCLIFGSTRVLKNYSKSREDVGVILSESINNGKESFITVVDFEDLVNKHGMLDQRQLLFFSILMGNDYSHGVKGLGKNKAFRLATLKNPDFSSKFYQVMHDITDENMTEKQEEYITFQKEVFEHCKKHSTELFGRDYAGSIFNNNNGNFEGWPDISVIIHLVRPLTKRPFNRELIGQKFSNISGSDTYKHIDFRELRDLLQLQFKLPNISNFDRWFHDTMHEMFLVKFLLHEFLDPSDDNTLQLRSKFKITSDKTVSLDNDQHSNGANHRIELWLVRYNSFLPGIEPMQRPTKSRSDTPSPTRGISKKHSDTTEYQHYLWIPKRCLPSTHILVVEYRAREKVRHEEEERAKKLRLSRTSPRRRLAGYRQTNNLDGFLKKHATSIGKGAPYIYENKLLDPVKKRLFVNDEIEEPKQGGGLGNFVTVKKDECEASENEEGDESLIILGEVHKSKDSKSVEHNVRDRQALQAEDFFESPLKKRKLPEVLRRDGNVTPNFREHLDTAVGSNETFNPTDNIPKSQQLLWTKVPFLSRADTFTSTKSSSVLDRLLPSDLETSSRGTSCSDSELEILDEVNKTKKPDEKGLTSGMNTEEDNDRVVNGDKHAPHEVAKDTDEGDDTITTDFFSEGDNIFFDL